MNAIKILKELTNSVPTYPDRNLVTLSGFGFTLNDLNEQIASVVEKLYKTTPTKSVKADVKVIDFSLNGDAITLYLWDVNSNLNISAHKE